MNEDTAAVLADIMSEIERILPADRTRSMHWSGLIERAHAALAQATTGARTAGGEPTFEMIERGAGAAYEAQRVGDEPLSAGPWGNVKTRRWGYQQDAYKHWYEIAEAVLLAAPPSPSAPGVHGYVLGTCFRDTQGNRHREGWSGDWYATRARADEELAKWPGDRDYEAAVFEVRLAYDPHQYVWCPTCDDYPGGRCTDHTGRVCCITHGTKLVPLAPSGADGEGT